MPGVDIMNTREANVALLSTLPEDAQEKIYVYLTHNFCNGNPYKPKTANDIFADLAKSRNSHQKGEYQDFDDAIDEISAKYGL